MTFKFAYIKLTIFYTLIIMLISIVFSLILYQISFAEINQGFDRQIDKLRLLPPKENSIPIPFKEFEQIRQEQIKLSEKNLKNNLFYFNLTILVISSFGSYFFARKTLEPIRKIMDSQKLFTSDASHELRTPLSVMKTEIEVSLRDKNFDLSQAKKLLTSNLEEINKLENLSNALLKLAQYEEKEIKFDQINLDKILHQAVKNVIKTADNKNINIKINSQLIEIKGDQDALTELFTIILDNSIKYSHTNSKIKIQIKKKKNSALVSIKDYGMGIKNSDIPYIFNRFYRSDPSRSKIKANGYGLGLSIAKRIIELHKGNIKVTSQLEKGSEFIISFPLI